MHHPTDRITHTTAFVTPVVEHWLEREWFDKSSTHFFDGGDRRLENLEERLYQVVVYQIAYFSAESEPNFM